MAGSGASSHGKLFNKVVAVTAGESHTLVLTADGRVYSWGKGMFGRLGNGSESDELFPVRVKFDLEEKERLIFVKVAAGAYHSLALADDGSVWCWGYNLSDGQLGFNGENSAKPCLLKNFPCSSDSLANEPDTKSRPPLKICVVKAGGMMSLAIDNHGVLWIWGDFPQPNASNEDQFSLTSSCIPTPIRDFFGHIVVKVACGNEHVVVLVSAGETYKGEDLACYSWGKNNHGQLGLGDRESRLNPQLIEIFNKESPWKVYEVACGASHTALLSNRKCSNGKIESLCWTFGLGNNGQLGHGTTQSESLPQPVKELPNDVKLISVDCGLFHTSTVSSDGDVWSWGMERGLGLCPDACFTGTDAGDALSPLLISCGLNPGGKFLDPIQVACGAAHTVIVAHDGSRLWSWGRGRNGVLGNNKTVDCYTPTTPLWPPMEDFKPEEPKSADEENKTGDESFPEKEMDEKMCVLMGEMRSLEERLSKVEKYASVLHSAVFGKAMEEKDIPVLLQKLGSFEIGREWENMLDEADQSKLVRLETFYRQMLGGVKDKLMKRKIQDLIKECLHSSPTTANY